MTTENTVRDRLPEPAIGLRRGLPSACGGLFRRKEIWLPSARGWCVVLGLMAAAAATIFFGTHGFLAVTERQAPDVLVLDGWLPDYALLEGWREFQIGHYSTLLTVGGPFRSGVNLDASDTYADLAALSLRRMVGKGIPVNIVRCPKENRDRTFTSAKSVKAWLAERHQTPASVTIITLGPHARRSRLLYEDAFGPDMPLGVVALVDRGYDPDHWWRYSEGVKELISESAAYVYARFFFHPSAGD